MKTIAEAIKDRDQFLEDHPHLKWLQKDIDRIVNATPDQHRLDALSLMLAASFIELSKGLKELSKDLPE